MKVFFRGVPGSCPVPVWPEEWPIPRVGDDVIDDDGIERRVLAVAWYPQGDEALPEPFVYVVLS